MLSGKAFNSPNGAISPSRTGEVSLNQTTAGEKSSVLFQRIAEADMTAVCECLAAHGNLVCAAAKKYTASRQEAETATQEIFLDIWKYADRFNSAKQSETDFVILVARRRLLKRIWKTS